MNLQRGRILARRTRAELITIIAEGCPVCTTGRSRVTEGMVCQHCGRDYAPLVDELAAPLRAWLDEADHEIRRQS